MFKLSKRGSTLEAKQENFSTIQQMSVWEVWQTSLSRRNVKICQETADQLNLHSPVFLADGYKNLWEAVSATVSCTFFVSISSFLWDTVAVLWWEEGNWNYCEFKSCPFKSWYQNLSEILSLKKRTAVAHKTIQDKRCRQKRKKNGIRALMDTCMVFEAAHRLCMWIRDEIETVDTPENGLVT